MKFLSNEEAQMRDEYEKEIRELKCEIARLRGRIETLVTVLELEGIKYSLNDEPDTIKRKLEIRKLKKIKRKKLRAMMWSGYEASCGCPAGLRDKQQLEREVDEICARIAELRGDA